MVNYQEANCVIGKNKTMFKYIYTVYVYIYINFTTWRQKIQHKKIKHTQNTESLIKYIHLSFRAPSSFGFQDLDHQHTFISVHFLSFTPELGAFQSWNSKWVLPTEDGATNLRGRPAEQLGLHIG